MKQWIPLLALVLSGCTHSKPDFSWAKPADRLGFEAKVASYDKLSGLLARCRAASRMEVFEGLPRPMADQETWVQESERTDTFLNHDFRFYRPAMQLPSAQRSKVLSSVVRDSSFQAWSGPKYCGGFHPDLLVRFHSDSSVLDVHLCFGCGEAKFIDGPTVAHVDIRDDIVAELRRVQEACRTKRPQPIREGPIDALLNHPGYGGPIPSGNR